MHNAFSYFCILISIIFSLNVNAATLKEIEFKETFLEEGTSYQLNGAGLRTYMFVDVYAAGLYLKNKTNSETEILDSDSARIIKMNYFRDISKDDLVKVWDIALAENCPGSCEPFKKAFEEFTAAVIEVKKGTEIIYLFTPEALEIRNPGATVKIEKAGFAKIVLATWIGPKPPTQKLKKALLGK